DGMRPPGYGRFTSATISRSDGGRSRHRSSLSAGCSRDVAGHSPDHARGRSRRRVRPDPALGRRPVLGTGDGLLLLVRPVGGGGDGFLRRRAPGGLGDVGVGTIGRRVPAGALVNASIGGRALRRHRTVYEHGGIAWHVAARTGKPRGTWHLRRGWRLR